jgi:hypothetical protein
MRARVRGSENAGWKGKERRWEMAGHRCEPVVQRDAQQEQTRTAVVTTQNEMWGAEKEWRRAQSAAERNQKAGAGWRD